MNDVVSVRRIGGHVSCSGGIENAITNTLLIGGNCMQIFAGSPRMWVRSLYNESVAAKFKLKVKENDLGPVFIHALYLTNLASDNDELVRKSKRALITDLTNSSLIGSAGVVLHIGSHQGRGWQDSKDACIANIKDVLSATPQDSNLLLENSAGQKGKVGSFEELHDILSAIDDPRLRVCLDTAHSFEAGYNFGTDEGLNIWIKDIGKYIANRLDVLHLNDSKTPVGSGRDMHQNIGDGYIGETGIKRIINHPVVARLPLILEVPGLEGTGPDKANIDRVKSLIL